MHGFNFSIIAKKCIYIIQPANRIGGESGNAQIIKDHIFFRDIDWEKISRKEVTPPFIPDVKGPGDFKYASHDLIRTYLMHSSEDKFYYGGLEYFIDYSYKRESSNNNKPILLQFLLYQYQ